MGWPYQQKPPMGWPLDYDSGLADFVGAWFFLEGSGGQVFDLSGNGHTGNFATNAPSWSAGHFGYAINFPGTNEYIIVPYNTTIISPTMTVVCSFSIPDTDDHYVLLGRLNGNSAGGENGIEVKNDGTLHTNYRMNAANNDLTSTSTVTLNNPHLAVGTFTSGSQKLYLDGNLEASGSVVGDYESGVQDMYIGYGADNTANLDYHKGLINFVILYDRVLSASEVALLHRYPFWMFKDPAEVALLGSYQAVVGAAGIMTTNTGYWGPTF